MASAINMQASNETKAISTVTKTKYKVLKEKLTTYLEDNETPQLDDILQVICDSLLFDPHKTSYDKEQVMRKCAETGLNTYEIYTRKYYEKNKEFLDKQSTEQTRIRRAAKKERDTRLAIYTSTA